MNCKENKCLCKNYCTLFGCALRHPLINDESKKVFETLKLYHESRRLKVIIDIFQEKQPPKVRRAHIDRYYLLRKHKGIDLDKDDISQSQREFHLSLKKKKRRTKIAPKKILKTKLKKLAAEILKDPPYPKRIQSAEEIEYLQNQTIEQLELSKKHGWKIAKALTAPQENFHLAD